MFTFLWLYIEHKQFNHIDNLQLVCWNWLAFIECWHPCSLVKPRDMKLWLWFGRVDDAEKISVSVFAARAISCSLGYCHVLCLQIKVQSRLSLLQLQMKDLLFSCPWMMIDAITWCCSSSISGHTLQTIRHGSHLQSTSHLPIHCISCDDFGDLKKDDSVERLRTAGTAHYVYLTCLLSMICPAHKHSQLLIFGELNDNHAVILIIYPPRLTNLHGCKFIGSQCIMLRGDELYLHMAQSPGTPQDEQQTPHQLQIV